MKIKNNQSLPEEEAILGLLASGPLRLTAIAKFLKMRHAQFKRLEGLLKSLSRQDKVEKLPGGLWRIKTEGTIVEGQFFANPRGGGRVRVTCPANYPRREIAIPPLQAGDAWHKDSVKVAVASAPDGDTGKIIGILHRWQTEIPALLTEKLKHSWIFKPAEGREAHLFLVKQPKSTPLRVRIGDAVLLKPLEQLKGKYKGKVIWSAKIVSVLGEADRVKAQEAIVKENNQVPGDFPPLALEQAAQLPAVPGKEEIAARTDMRSMPFVTIDGADARDFDDAIMVEKIGDDYLLRVAIADVGEYVQPDERPGSLDREAMARGNSWYFPTSVEPMLPKALSNGLCSLNPGQDRLAMLAEMRFDKQGKLMDKRFAPVTINSKARLTYDQAAAFFGGEQAAISDPKLQHMLRDAFELYKILAHQRRERGTLDFILPEPKYEFDSEGHVTGMGVAQRNDAHMLIEEFMIAANETVANWLGEQSIPILYRVHPGPEPEKLNHLFKALRETVPEVLPAELLKPDTGTADDIQKILTRSFGTPQEFVVNRLCLRSMGQARYQTDNIGHFGLASAAYCHFTSPIRRYADLLVHRALKATLARKGTIPDKNDLDEIGADLNLLERRAVDSEREMAKRMACLALSGQEGMEMTGTISAITDFGVFMEFDSIPAEGLIRLEDLGNDWFEADHTRQMLTGMRTGKVYRIGDPIKAAIKEVNMERLEVHLSREGRRIERLTQRHGKCTGRTSGNRIPLPPGKKRKK